MRGGIPGFRRVRTLNPETPAPLTEMRALPAADYDEAIAALTDLIKLGSEVERYGHKDAQQPAGRLVEYALKAGTALTRSRR